MPFDGPIPTTKPDLRILSDVLRGGPEHPMWPKDFRWDYSYCETCAMGIAGALWREVSDWSFVPNTEAGCMITHDLVPDSDHHGMIFTRLGSRIGKRTSTITPTDVADAIDEYLETSNV